MKFAIITHTPHGTADQTYFAYAPYVREMNLWNQFADEVTVVAPHTLDKKNDIHLDYTHKKITFVPIAAMNLLGWCAVLRSIGQAPVTCWRIFQAMRRADHIHLRCPGNIGLLGCMVQILFPHKSKTAKYAGNWDPRAPQPLSYKIQRWILGNTLLTKNMQVLVYGNWPQSSPNIKPFFTATYREADKADIAPRALDGTLRFLFVGSLSPGKRPMQAVLIVEQLAALGHKVQLELYGEGKERAKLEQYIAQRQLSNVTLKGNQTEAVVRKAYQSAHFLVLPSQSEGWPKVVAEAMFWGCLPVATPVSCVPFMLDDQNRGVLLQMKPEADVAAIDALIHSPDVYRKKVLQAIAWSRDYTLDLFEQNIKTLLR